MTRCRKNEIIHTWQGSEGNSENFEVQTVLLWHSAAGCLLAYQAVLISVLQLQAMEACSLPQRPDCIAFESAVYASCMSSFLINKISRRFFLTNPV